MARQERCPQCGSVGAVHSVDELEAMARARLGQFGLGYQGPPQGYQQPPGYQAPPPGYQPPPGAPPPPPASGFPSSSSGFPSAPLSSDLPPPPPPPPPPDYSDSAPPPGYSGQKRPSRWSRGSTRSGSCRPWPPSRTPCCASRSRSPNGTRSCAPA